MNLMQVASLCTALLLAGCGTMVQNPVTGKAERSVMDERTEVTEGAKAHQEILKEYTPLNNPGLQAYVNGVGQKLAAHSHRGNLKWTFTVLDSPEVNAFALPGGYVYITRGLMAYLDSEAELASVLGHEIGHVTARHSAQRATRQQNAGLGVLAATLGGVLLEAAGVGGAADLASQASQMVAAGHIASYGREQELQADQLGAEYVARIRYNPNNMVDVIQVLKNQERYAADAARSAGRAAPAEPGWLASHPSNDQRLAEIRQTATRLAQGGTWGDDGRERYLRTMDRVTFGDGAEQGVVRGRNFYHESLGIAMTAPPGYRIVNGAEKLTIINGEGDAALVMQMAPPKYGTNHEQILRQGLGATEGRTERPQLASGLAATRYVGNVRDAQGQAKSMEVTLVTGPENRVYLLGYATRDAAALQRARPGLREIEASFRPLSPSERNAARPWHIKLVPYPAGGFAQLARNSPLTELAEQQLRLMNGAYGGSPEPRVGQLVKVVE